MLPNLSCLVDSVGAPGAVRVFSSLQEALTNAQMNVYYSSNIERAHIYIMQNGQVKFVIEVTGKSYELSRNNAILVERNFDDHPPSSNKFAYAETVILGNIGGSESGYSFKLMFYNTNMGWVA